MFLLPIYENMYAHIGLTQIMGIFWFGYRYLSCTVEVTFQTISLVIGYSFYFSVGLLSIL